MSLSHFNSLNSNYKCKVPEHNPTFISAQHVTDHLGESKWYTSFYNTMQFLFTYVSDTKENKRKENNFKKKIYRTVK
jgi:hypothetical protein